MTPKPSFSAACEAVPYKDSAVAPQAETCPTTPEVFTSCAKHNSTYFLSLERNAG
jgi:hypothetical protein